METPTDDDVLDAVPEPQFDDIFLRDMSGESYYFHLSLKDSAIMLVILFAEVYERGITAALPTLNEMKVQLANQGIDWEYMAKLNEEHNGRET